MKKINIILLFLTLLQHSFAGVGIKVVVDPKKEKPLTDTVPFVFNEEELMNYNDSLTSLPGYGLYSTWDTENIHYAKFDVASLKDSVKEIVLADPNSCGYVPPRIGNVTSGFGPRKRVFHYGIDLHLLTGDPVVAAFDGKVRITKKSKTYGNVIVIRHNNGIETYYAHLSKINVEVGQNVFAGENIGLGGNTGHSTGSHLHFEVRYLGQPINPTDLISFTDHKLISDTLALSQKTFDYIAEAKKIAAFASKKHSRSKKGKGSKKNYMVKKGSKGTPVVASKAHKKTTSSAKVLPKKNGLKTTAKLHTVQKTKL